MGKLTASEIKENYHNDFVRVVVGSIIHDEQICLEEDVSLYVLHTFRYKCLWTVSHEQVKIATGYWKKNDIVPVLKREVERFGLAMAEHEGVSMTGNFREALLKYEDKKKVKAGVKHIKLIEDATII